jgi:hypothetical protein
MVSNPPFNKAKDILVPLFPGDNKLIRAHKMLTFLPEGINLYSKGLGKLSLSGVRSIEVAMREPRPYSKASYIAADAIFGVLYGST